MIFLDRKEAKRWEANLRRRVVEKPRSAFYYDSHRGNDFLSAARALAASFGEFREATLLYLSCPFGDGWSETQMTDPRWARFRNWRESHGETRRLYDVPGHQFAAHEGEALIEAIEFALRLGWDAWLDGNLRRKFIAFSHDDRVELHRGCERSNLEKHLLALGYWQTAAVR